MDPTGKFYFDPTRQTGAEYLQGTLVQLDGVRLVSGTWAPNKTVVVTDGQQRLMTVNIGNNSNLTVAPTGAFNIVGIEDQESTDGSSQDGYTLWLTDSGNVTPVQPASNGAFQWSGSGGSWTGAHNWIAGGTPQNAGDTAIFAGALAIGGTVTLDGAQKAGGLIFGALGRSTNGYTLSPGAGGTLTLDNSGSEGFIIVTGGSHAIAAPLTVDDNLLATVDSGAGLTISAGISQGNPGLSLTVQGGGTLVLGGTSDYMGGTTVADGTLIVEDAAALADGTSLTVGSATTAFTNAIGAGGSPSAVPVATAPEPTTLTLFACAIGCFLLKCRLRRKGP
jgi:autotransporter-associated beta strand protein